MGLLSFTSIGTRDIAVDLGTANTLVYLRGEGIVLSEPSVVATDSRDGTIHAVGEEAKQMIGRTPATISATRPLRHGVIADFETTEQMLRYFIRRPGHSRFARPRLAMCAPSGITGVEQRALEEASRAAGARDVQLIEEPIAAAVGAGLAIEEPAGHMIVDVGGGTSEVAVLSLGEIAESVAVRVGGYDLDEAISNHVKRDHRLAIGAQTAENLKIELGSAWQLDDGRQAEVRGRDLVTGLPKTVTLSDEEVRGALEEPLQSVIAAVRETLERTPPELAGDVVDRGITLTGGGALLQGFDRRLAEETLLGIHMAESPLASVALGAGRALEEFDTMARASKSSARRR
jgi:rod shape-determining protein MreB and related proteins